MDPHAEIVARVQADRRSHRAIAQEAGIARANLSRYITTGRGLSPTSVLRLAYALGGRLVWGTPVVQLDTRHQPDTIHQAKPIPGINLIPQPRETPGINLIPVVQLDNCPTDGPVPVEAPPTPMKATPPGPRVDPRREMKLKR